MAKHLVKEKSFVNGAIVEAGAIVDYDPPEGVTVSANLELIPEEPAEPASPAKGKRAKAEA